jgi:hypothetical protein
MRFAVIPKDEQRTVSQAGQFSGHSAASVTRWIEDGAKLRDGRRLKLRAERYPSGWRTTEAWVADFIDELTRDRTEQAAPSETAKERAQTANVALAAGGW